ncbi:MAG: TIGR01212 family radical SAM protein [Syntrophales bacterium]
MKKDNQKEEPLEKPDFWHNTKRYYDLKSYFLNTFGCKVYKLQIDAGFTCPNRDGRVAYGGCTYCDGRGSKLRQGGPLPSVSRQIEIGKAHYMKIRGARKFIAYFQTFTNTYAPVDHLRTIYNEALSREDILGLSIGTRPDCVPDAVVDLLETYGKHHHIWVEYGLQSIHDRTLRALNRGHTAAQFLDAVHRTAERGIHICAHIIVGLPGESHGDMMETARALAKLPVQGIKIHSLLALKGTPLGHEFERGRLSLLSRETYIETVCDMLEILPSNIVIHRLTADGYRDILLGPSWAVNKMDVLNGINHEMNRRRTYQGFRSYGTETE